jgi:hypothetical protein
MVGVELALEGQRCLPFVPQESKLNLSTSMRRGFHARRGEQALPGELRWACPERAISAHIRRHWSSECRLNPCQTVGRFRRIGIVFIGNGRENAESRRTHTVGVTGSSPVPPTNR